MKSVSIDFANFAGGMRTDVDESVLPLKYARKTYNFRTTDGALTTGLGLSPLSLPTSSDGSSERTMIWDIDAEPLKVVKFQYFSTVSNTRKDRLLVYASNGKVYWCNIEDNFMYFTSLLFQFVEAPCILNYRLNGVDVALLSSPSDALSVWTPGLSAQQPTNAPALTSMCLHYERVFATTSGEKNAVWFSDDMDPTNWEISSEEGGYIEMADELGDCNKVLSFNNYLYVFRSFGITRITAFADQSTFSVMNIYTSSNSIFANTACVCGSVMLFMATDGLYSFDGASAKKLNLGFESIFQDVQSSKVVATFHKNHYYLLCNTTLETLSSEYDNYCNTLFSLDIDSGESEVLFGYKFVDIVSVGQNLMEKLIIIASDGTHNILYELSQSGAVSTTATTKVWESAFTDLGLPSATKNFRSMHVVTDYPMTATVRTENDERTINLDGVPAVPQRIRLGIAGKMLAVSLTTSSQFARISHPTIEFSKM